MVFIVEGTQDIKVNKNEQKWIDIGVEFRKAKEKGVTSKAFAAEKGIVYSTFTKSMSRYASKITLAYKADQLAGKNPKTLNRDERALVMINSFRSSLKQKVRNEGAASNTKSEKWFRETISKSVKGHRVAKPVPGKLYAYVYDAKHKDTLPYWDQYPLIIFLGFKVTRSGSTIMHGLNLHYVPPKARQEFLESLLKQYASTPVISNSTKLKIDWSKVRGFKGADKMIKAYLPSHIKGTIVEIKPSDWANVIMMPLQRFQSSGKNHSARKVWG